MANIERYTSPDKILELIVDCPDGDWTIGFAGQDWHTHGDILSAYGYKGPPEEATRRYVEDILASRVPIVVRRIAGRIRTIMVAEHTDHKKLAEEMAVRLAKYGVAGETFEIRYWNGPVGD